MFWFYLTVELRSFVLTIFWWVFCDNRSTRTCTLVLLVLKIYFCSTLHHRYAWNYLFLVFDFFLDNCFYVAESFFFQTVGLEEPSNLSIDWFFIMNIGNYDIFRLSIFDTNLYNKSIVDALIMARFRLLACSAFVWITSAYAHVNFSIIIYLFLTQKWIIFTINCGWVEMILWELILKFYQIEVISFSRGNLPSQEKDC